MRCFGRHGIAAWPAACRRAGWGAVCTEPSGGVWDGWVSIISSEGPPCFIKPCAAHPSFRGGSAGTVAHHLHRALRGVLRHACARAQLLLPGKQGGSPAAARGWPVAAGGSPVAAAALCLSKGGEQGLLRIALSTALLATGRRGPAGGQAPAQGHALPPQLTAPARLPLPRAAGPPCRMSAARSTSTPGRAALFPPAWAASAGRWRSGTWWRGEYDSPGWPGAVS